MRTPVMKKSSQRRELRDEALHDYLKLVTEFPLAHAADRVLAHYQADVKEVYKGELPNHVIATVNVIQGWTSEKYLSVANIKERMIPINETLAQELHTCLNAFNKVAA